VSDTLAPRDVIAESRERFTRETAEHEMAVLHDDGLYRHLRFQRPETVTYYFDLVTWPGHLAVVGDCGDFVFSRTRDMFEFFEGSHGRINPGYWSEKLRAPHPDGAERFSADAFRSHVLEWFEQAAEDIPAEARDLRAALDEQVLGDDIAPFNEHQAHQLVADFEWNGRRIYDSWEWSLREYDWSFLWCCHAIVYGIAKYRSAS
jgi:hypothetical protein